MKDEQTAGNEYFTGNSDSYDPLLETNKHIFSSGKESPLCKCCGTENEDVTHFLLLCPVLYKQRKE